jgi:hypothetical protein
MTGTIGMNLQGPSDWTTECWYIDRMLMARAPAALNKDTPLPAFDPLTGFPTEAGIMYRAIPLDPASKAIPRDYVLLCDEGVVSVGTPWGTMKPVNGRATIRITSASLGVGLLVTSSGPVKKFAFMRSEHEVLYLAGEIFNPDFITAVKNFAGLRFLDPNAANYSPPVPIGAPLPKNWPPRRPLPTDGYFSEVGGGLPAEHVAQLLQRIGKNGWYVIPPMMQDADISYIAMIFAAFGIPMRFELGNELNWSYHARFVQEQTRLYLNKAPDAKLAYFDILEWYGWRSGQIAKLIAPHSPDLSMILASQASEGTSNIPPILKGWAASGAPASMIYAYTNASYLNLNSILPALLTAKDNKDPEAAYAAIDGLRPRLKARHVLTVKNCQTAGAPYGIGPLRYVNYEGGPSLYTRRVDLNDDAKRLGVNLDTLRGDLLTFMGPIWHTERMANIEMAMIQDAFDAGSEEFYHFLLSGQDTQFGVWNTMAHITLPPYPIYDRLVKAIAPVAVKADDLPSIRTAIADALARLDAVIAG